MNWWEVMILKAQKNELVITGHSLGGALSTLAAFDFNNLGIKTNLITFGSPRVGNEKFAKELNKRLVE